MMIRLSKKIVNIAEKCFRYDKRGKLNSASSNKESGFIFSALAITVVIILGLTALYLTNTVSLNITEASDVYSASQSYLSSLSGIEYAIENMSDGLDNIPGSYSFFNSEVTITLSNKDRLGNALPAHRTRVISASGHSNSLRILELLIEISADQDVWPDTSLIEVVSHGGGCDKGEDLGHHPCISVIFSSDNKCVYIESTCHEISNIVLHFEDCTKYKHDNLSGYTGTWCGTGSNQGKKIVGVWVKSGNNLCGEGPGYGEYFENTNISGGGTFNIEEDVRLNGMIYIGGDVKVDEDATMGDPPYNPAHILVPSGKTVEGEFDRYFSWAQHANGSASLPDFNFSEYDSLINIAKSITETSGNKYLGDFILDGSTLDLSVYADNTFFIKGKLIVKGSTITGGALMSPGIIVVTKEISVIAKHNIQSIINDNIIFISDKEVSLEDYSRFGANYSALNPENRPATVNEIYSNYKVEVEEHAVAWAQIYSLGKMEIEYYGRVYGLVYTAGGFEFERDAPFLMGMLFAKKVVDPKNKFKKGTVILSPYYPLHYFSGIGYRVVPHTLREI